jgi:hypothetical protein
LGVTKKTKCDKEKIKKPMKRRSRYLDKRWVRNIHHMMKKFVIVYGETKMSGVLIVAM